MGIATSKHLVKHAAEELFTTDDILQETGDYRLLLGEESLEPLHEEADIPMPDRIDFAGWLCLFSDRTKPYSSEAPLWAHVWRKGDLTVWTVNVSPWESIGHISVTAVSDDLASLQTFLRDWKLPRKTVSPAVVLTTS